jgi:hypothetical protein
MIVASLPHHMFYDSKNKLDDPDIGPSDYVSLTG